MRQRPVYTVIEVEDARMQEGHAAPSRVANGGRRREVTRVSGDGVRERQSRNSSCVGTTGSACWMSLSELRCGC